MILGRARCALALRLKFPAVFQHQRIDDGNGNQVLQLFQLAENQGAVRPGAGEGDIEVVTVLLRLEAAFSGRAGRAIRRDPVAELRGAALEVPLVSLVSYQTSFHTPSTSMPMMISLIVSF